MNSVFGLPAGPLATVLVIAVAVALVAIGALAASNPIFVKMGLRNIPRRRGRSALIVVGLMLGTAIIASALLTGDTMTSTVRSAVVESLGETDELVTGGTDADTLIATGLEPSRPYFESAPVVDLVDRVAADLPVDGVAAAIVEPVGSQHEAAGRTEPGTTLFAVQEDRADDFGFGAVTTLADDEAIIDLEAADDLAAGVGDRLRVLAADRLLDLRVAQVVDIDGAGSDGPSVVVPLTVAQRLLGHDDEANVVMVSNDGDATSGAAATAVVEPALDAALEGTGLTAQAAKQDGLDAADAAGDQFVQLFTTFGSFSMAAGVLLIFLIFVMLAAERRPEMGMARAVGMQRRHLVRSFVYEGVVYDLVAAAAGTALGIGVSYVMVRTVAAAFSTEGLEVTYAMSARSLVISACLGILLTLLVVALSARRVSRLNIVSAIRDIPEQAVQHRVRRSRWALVGSGVVVGLLLAVSGAGQQTFMPFMLGVSIVLMSMVSVARLLRRGERAAYTFAGASLLVLWLLPFDTFDAAFGEMKMDFSVWIVGGLIVVVAATWLVTYNADVLLGLASRLASPFRSLRPIAKMAVAYPLRSRFRTGVTLSMFMLVVFTLVTGSTIPSAFTDSFDDVERFGGGFDVRVATAPATAVDDLRSVLPPDVAERVTAEGSQSFVAAEVRQADDDGGYEVYPLRGVDDGFLRATSYELSARAEGYVDDRAVWDALAAQPGLAVVDPYIAPRRDDWGFGAPTQFELSGFYLEDGDFDPVEVDVHDPLTGADLTVTVVGVLGDNSPQAMAGITVSQAALAPFGDRAVPTVHHLATDADPSALAADVEAALLSRGAEAETYDDVLDDAVGASMIFIRLVQGFMALGLVVGVAALGVVSARAVVERRQQIGMLRAIGFQPEMIRRTFLAETGIVAGSALVVGGALGLLVSYNVIADSRQVAANSGLRFAVPWLDLGLIMVAVMAAAAFATVVSARRAARTYPAEALRYQ